MKNKSGNSRHTPTNAYGIGIYFSGACFLGKARDKLCLFYSLVTSTLLSGYSIILKRGQFYMALKKWKIFSK